MKIQVRFRFNRRTGEVEEFLVDDYSTILDDAEHNRLHDRVTHEIGQVISRHPKVEEIQRSNVLTSREPKGQEISSMEGVVDVIRQQNKQS